MAVEVIYIFYSYVFGLYNFLLKFMMAEHNHGCHQKYSFCLFITFKSTYLKSVHYGPKSKAIISHDWCEVLGLYFVSSCMWQSYTYFEDSSMLVSIGIKYS